jgi:hypothetical protein
MAATTTETRRDAGAALETLDLVRKLEARQKALAQVTMHMLATLAGTAPKEDVERLLAELERIRDLTGPAGFAAGEVIATAISTLERASRR